VVGGLSDPVVVPDAVKHARKLLLAPYPQSGAEWIGGAELFYEIAATPPALFMFGAGYDAVPVAQLAWTLGFSVTVVDVREAFLTADRFPGATLVGTDFSRLADRLHLPAGSFVLVMNHHVERDQDSLRFALESDAAYVGVLGPRSRLDKLLTGLAKQGYVPASTKLARVRNPIGLSLGAETAEEVAVSILGEILAIRRGFEGGFLNGSVRSLHRPDDKRLLARS
jgi:xanthine/CO dehydrogenase XdhC/CoxF family maturation factor